MRLLVVNWQDRENPQAGGAEVHLHEIFGRLVHRGHRVDLLCGGWDGCPPVASLDGIEVTRVGTRTSFPFLARRMYERQFARNSYDLVIEDINKIPLWTPRWSGARVVGLVPHLFGGTAFQELAFPLAAVVWAAERPIPWVYRRTPFQVISQGTADDLASRGIPRSRIEVIYCGIDSEHYTPGPGARSRVPIFAYLGRLKRYKRVDLVVRAFARADVGGARLEIAGAGDGRGDLERLVASLDLTDRVTFLGRIAEDEKLALLRRAWALVLTSPKEGWGITNLEAAACGTPVLASDSPGIRESVRHGETGFLLPHGDVDALAGAMRQLASAQVLVDSLGSRGRRFAETFTWERAASETEAHLHSVLARG
ncbi:MAG: D-inositol-3-phosphate glycosyltransferase [Gemmatimonadaceae bacterium]|nr:D-inositol-3-phosphate glycosyltransferase [Gemmatimonadaceae bacterium]